ILRRSMVESIIHINTPDSPATTPPSQTPFAVPLHSRDFAIIPLKDSHLDFRHRDELVIPSREARVYLSGAVKKPGSYTFSPGKSYHHYIAAAGGFTRHADRRGTTVAEMHKEAYRIVPHDSIPPGALIIVPARDRLRSQSVSLEITRTILTALSTLVTVIVLVREM
ncbi:MAG: SLBB domain-containing protein, partial [Chitinivibrionales bacterium]|nr:SLBB domain-containing protein [Chitinivibrionales bacterium]